MGEMVDYLDFFFQAEDGIRDRTGDWSSDVCSSDLHGLDFAERCEDDRHHFRFIISPEDAAEMEDLRGDRKSVV